MKQKKHNFFISGIILAIIILFVFLYQGVFNEDVKNNSDNTRVHTHNINVESIKVFDSIVKSPQEIPKPILRNYSKTVSINLTTKEIISKIDKNKSYVYWTFNNTVPGPFLRVREGDIIELTLTNDKTSQFHHSIDLHAVTGPGGGGVVTQVGPGESKKMKFKALQPGLYVYHCATPDIPHHIANGMYGLILVEPKQGLKKVDKEFYLMQGEFYLGEPYEHARSVYQFNEKKMIDEDPDYIVFNGRVGALLENPMLASVNETIRLFVGNGGVSKISSFHVIGEIFNSVFPEGSLSSEHKNVQTTLIPAGGSSVVEFKVNVPGNYILVDHALSRLEKGASGVIQVTGKNNSEIYQGFL
jgi:nitrite reductase (NO-forming)